MLRRKRLIPALFALSAMTLSLAETVWASTCAPGEESGVIATAVEPMEPGVEAQHMPDMAHDQQSGGEEPCPMDPGAVQGCTAGPSFPAQSAEAPAPRVDSAPSVSSDRAQQDLLSASLLFRPPRT